MRCSDFSRRVSLFRIRETKNLEVLFANRLRFDGAGVVNLFRRQGGCTMPALKSCPPLRLTLQNAVAIIKSRGGAVW